MVKRYFSVISVASIVLVLGINLIAHAQQPLLPKKEHEIKTDSDSSKVWENKKVTIHTYEEDIQTTLRALARLAGLSITFGEGITDTVSLDLENFPAKKAFDMIIEEYGLDYKQDVDSIYVFKRGVVQELLIKLENIEMEEAKRAIERFGFMKKEVKIVFDLPTDSIFIAGPPRDVGNIKNLINVLESTKKRSLEVKPEIRYFPLRYAKVNNMELTIGKQTVTVKGLVAVLTEILELTVQGEQTSLKARIVDEKLKQDQALEKKDVISPQEERAKILKKMIGAEAGTITSDPRTNQIIIRDYPEKLNEYAKIIQQLDQPMKMVKIDVTIVEASKDFAREVGVGITGVGTQSERVKYLPSSSAPSRDIFSEAAENFKGDANPDAGQPTITPTTGPDTLSLYPLSETVAGTPISAQGITGTFLYWGSKAVLATTLQAAESRGISKTINKSSIVTMDNMKAIVDSTTTITYKLRSGGGDEAITVEDREIDAGIVLETTPHIIETDDNRTLVELVLNAERSTFLATRTDDIPHELSTALNTQAVVGNNNTLVIGGFFDNIYTRGETGIPCLMNIPGAGHLFKTESARNPKSNILFFLTPTVISLDKIPYEGPELKQKIEKHEKELKKIDGDRQEKLIEKYQD